jgi:hypothetical protein
MQKDPGSKKPIKIIRKNLLLFLKKSFPVCMTLKATGKGTEPL